MRLIKTGCAFLFVATTAGCANVQYIEQNYSGVAVESVETQYDTFRVFDKAGEGRMMITSSLGSAVGQGLVGGLLYNPTVGATPKPVFQEAVEKYLAHSGRRCVVLDGYLLAEPQWEFRYKCDAAKSTG